MLLATSVLAQDAVEPYPVITLEPEAEPAETDVPVLENIIVTASKRAQQQRDVPGSVAALRGSDLELIKAQNLADYLKQVPGVVLFERDADGGIPIIRGINTGSGGLTSATIITQLPVGIYVDDMPFTDLYLPLSMPDLNPFDLQRVEILKGPQGTLFGSGALAGGIRYVLQKPKPGIWETKLSATRSFNRYSDEPSDIAAAALNVPLKEGAALRLTGTLREQAGKIDEVDRGPDVDSLRQVSGRLQGQWEPSERLDLSGFYFSQSSDQANASGADNRRNFEREFGGFSRRESGFSGANFSARQAFDDFDLLSSSNYLRKDLSNDGAEPLGSAPVAGDSDGDGGDNGPGTEDAGEDDTVAYVLDSQTAGWLQEFRLSSPPDLDWQPWDWVSVQWLLGAAHQRSAQDVQQFIDSSRVRENAGPAEESPLLPVDTPQGSVQGSRELALLFLELDSVASETALFGEATARFGSHWEATLGLRAFRTRLRVDGLVAGAQNTAFDAGSTESEVHNTVRAQGLNPKLALRFLFNDRVQLYALAAKGFQFGGVQINPPVAVLTATLPEAFDVFESSKLWNYEIGLRSEFFARRLRLDLSLFRLDWRDLQITVRRPFVPGGENFGLTIAFIENIGRARSQGAEAALAFKPLPGLEFTSNAAWIKAVTTQDFEAATGFVAAGTRLPGSPRFQWSNILSYAITRAWLGAWQARINAIHSYLGASYNDLHYFREQGGYSTYDASLIVSKPKARIAPEISVSMLNISDRRGISAVNGAAGARDVDYFFVRPRTLMVSLGLQF